MEAQSPVRLRPHDVERCIPHANRPGSCGLGSQSVPSVSERRRRDRLDRPARLSWRPFALRHRRSAWLAGLVRRAVYRRARALRDRNAPLARRRLLDWCFRDAALALSHRPRSRPSRGPGCAAGDIAHYGVESILNQAQPRISVVIPLYNKQAYVERAVASVLQSGYRAHDVTVVDDGSTYDGPQYAAAMGAQRIERFFEIWGHGIFFCTCSVVIPVRILRDFAISFPEGEQHGEDVDVWFRIAERWPIAYLGQPLVGYRLGVPDSLMTSHPGDFPPAYERLAARYRSNAIPQHHRKGVARTLSVARLLSARRLLLESERRRALKLLYDPSCLRAPRFWLRLFLAAHMPALLGRQLIP